MVKIERGRATNNPQTGRDRAGETARGGRRPNFEECTPATCLVPRAAFAHRPSSVPTLPPPRLPVASRRA
eukprot:2428093-Pleurochrysis_carterae.AAC.2